MNVRGTRIPGRVVKDAEVLWKRLSEEFEKDDNCRVLAIMDFKGRKTFFEAYQIFENPGKFNIDQRSVIAIVYLNGDCYEEDKFGETVARNRFWNVMVFCNEPDAQKWLDGQTR